MWELVKAGGWLMLPLVLCSIFTVAITIERMIRLKKSMILPKALLLSQTQSADEVMQQGLLDMGHARAILTLKAKDQLKVAEHVIEKSLSVRQTEQLVRDLNAPKQEKAKADVAPDIQQLTQRLAERFSADVKIDHNKQGKGKLVIQYHSLDELDGILNICFAE